MKAIYWLRNDLRIHDNATLNLFCEQASQGLVVWCAGATFHRAGELRQSFVLHSLEEISVTLKTKGLPVIRSFSQAREIVPRLAQQYSIDKIFVSAEGTPEEKAEENDVAAGWNGTLQRVEQASLLHVDDLPFAVPETPDVFTQYRIQVEKQLRVRGPLPLPARWPSSIEGLTIPAFHGSLRALFHPQIAPGENAGRARLQDYLWVRDGLRNYKETRNGMLDWDDSSKLSPWLAVGALSPRTIYFEIQRYEKERCKNESTYWLFFELLWRDFFRLIMEKKQGEVFGKRPALEPQQERDLLRWMQAETGDDFIDANMIELAETGWLSNRGRQNVASYLAKELDVPWQYGAEYFEHQLIDYDPCNNWGNWAYLAGVGQDPRNRRFNTSRQADLYDPTGEYRKKWLTGRRSTSRT